MRITPVDLLALGFADAVVRPSSVGHHLASLVSMPAEERRARRWQRWGGRLPGDLPEKL